MKHVLRSAPAEADKGKKNSDVAAGRSKEVLARLFLDRVQAGSVSLSDETKTRINSVFKWIDEPYQTYAQEPEGH